MATGRDPTLTDTGRWRLAAILDGDLPIDEVFGRLATAPGDPRPQAPDVAIVPEEVVGAPELAELLHSVQAEYDEIEAALAKLREQADLAADLEHENALAFVSERELADPRTLARVLAPLQSDRLRFEVLFTQARRALERLDVYRLSRRGGDELVDELRRETRFPTVEYVVDFLRSLHRAADSFEALELPKSDIRLYLEHLYLTENWNEMGRLVRQLERAVADWLGKEEARAREERTDDSRPA